MRINIFNLNRFNYFFDSCFNFINVYEFKYRNKIINVFFQLFLDCDFFILF